VIHLVAKVAFLAIVVVPSSSSTIALPVALVINRIYFAFMFKIANDVVNATR